jgi:ADP-heptose:LPS heptosyltransferase
VWSQRGVEILHLIVDGASTDGTVLWLADTLGPTGTWTQAPMGGQPAVQVCWVSQLDAGLYDALNRGFAGLDADVLGWLNADEQYLPGALEFAVQWFGKHPTRHLLFGDFLLLDADGRPCARRRISPVRWPYVAASHLYGHSCAMFFRRQIWAAGFHFDASFKAAGDAEWVVRVLKAGFRAGTTSRPLAAFRLGPGRLSETPAALEEAERVRASALRWLRPLSGVIHVTRRIEQVLRGVWRPTRSFRAHLFWPGPRVAQVTIEARSLSARWPRVARPTPKPDADRVRYAVWKHVASHLAETLGGRTIARSVAEDSQPVHGVLILEPFRLGDAVLVARMAVELRRCWPNTRVSVLTHPSACTWVSRLAPGIQTLGWAFPWTSAPGPRQGWLATTRFLWSLRTQGFDVGLDPRGDVRSQIALCLAGCRRRVGLTRYLASNIRLRGLLLTDPVEVPDGAHRVELLARLMEALGLSGTDWTQPIALRTQRGHAVVLSPGAGWEFRQWPEVRWAELASRLIQSGCDVHLVGSPESRPVLERIQQLSDPTPRVRVTSLNEFLAEIRDAAVVVTPDSLAVHLASEWFGVPVVALFGPGVVPLYRPRSAGSVTLHHQERFPCAPCAQRRCIRPHDPCMSSISVEEVLHAVRSVLSACT